MADENYLKSVDQRLINLTAKVDAVMELMSKLVSIESDQTLIMAKLEEHDNAIAELQKDFGPIVKVRKRFTWAFLIVITALITAVTQNYVNKVFKGGSNVIMHRQDGSGGVSGLEDGEATLPRGESERRD